MTDTIDEAPAATDAQATAERWFHDFEAALTAGDVDGAAGLFLEESFWRDLVSFTWNLKTVEGPAEVADLLKSTVDSVQPSGFAIAEPPTEADGVTEAWFTFETAVGRGRGLVRIKEGKAWTLLTTLEELKGYEEPRKGNRPKGVQHGAFKERVTWKEARTAEADELGYGTQPYVLVIGGGQGGIGLGSRLRQLGVPALVIDKHPIPATSGATATSRCACTTRSGTTTCRTSSSPRTGRSSPRRTRSPTGSSRT